MEEKNNDHLNIPRAACVVTNSGNSGGAKQACAACKHQRKKCSQDCLLAPFFPGDKPEKFANAHRLFGVSNMLKILNSVKPDDREEAMTSITYESDIRAKHPVHGCLGVIRECQNEISRSLKDLAHYKILLTHYKEHYQNPFQSQFSMNRYSLSSTCEVPSFGGNAIHSHGPYPIENQPSSSSSYDCLLDPERFNLDDCSSPSLANTNTMKIDQERFNLDDCSSSYFESTNTKMICSSSTFFPMNQSSLPSVGAYFPTPTATPVDNNCVIPSFGGNAIHIENRATSSYPHTR